ncbi:unnamed protein product [Pedinophyceae sp. YPF-701]|nr:unnamed protein product [Pedinophyceae sp. YPF-701]
MRAASFAPARAPCAPAGRLRPCSTTSRLVARVASANDAPTFNPIRKDIPLVPPGTVPDPVELPEDLSSSGLRLLGDLGKANALHRKANPFEKKKNEKCGTTVWEDGEKMAQAIREGKTNWEDLDLDDVDMRLKWSGLFHRRKRAPGKFMMRVRLPNGEVTATQLRVMGESIEGLENGCGDITTRANIQLRGHTLDQAVDTLAALEAVGVTAKQSGMDNIRNITGNPIAGIDPYEVVDSRPYCQAIQDLITDHGRGNPEYANLPRKFNIAVNTTRDDFVHTHITDLSFDAVRNPATGALGFNVLVGGMLSTKRCDVAFPLDAWIPEEDLLSFTHAFMVWFRENGERQNRQAARVMYLLDKWGVERTRDEMARLMGQDSLARAVKEGHDEPWQRRDLIGVHPQKQEGYSYVGVCIPVGRLLPEDFKDMARIAEEYGDGTVRLTVDENAVFPNVPNGKVDAMLQEGFFQRFSVSPGPLTSGLVSCTGAQFCGFALAETKLPAMQMLAELEQELDIPRQVRIHFTGCPNSCGQAQAGDIGLIGAPAKKDGKATSGFNIIFGGTVGEGAKLATTQFEKSVPLDDVKDKLRELLVSNFGATPKAA